MHVPLINHTCLGSDSPIIIDATLHIPAPHNTVAPDEHQNHSRNLNNLPDGSQANPRNQPKGLHNLRKQSSCPGNTSIQRLASSSKPTKPGSQLRGLSQALVGRKAWLLQAAFISGPATRRGTCIIHHILMVQFST